MNKHKNKLFFFLTSLVDDLRELGNDISSSSFIVDGTCDTCSLFFLVKNLCGKLGDGLSSVVDGTADST